MAVQLPKELIKELDGLMRRLQSADAEARSLALSRLIDYERHGKLPLELLVEMAGEPEMTHAMYAITALGRNGQPAAVSRLLEILAAHRDDNPLFIETIIDALGESRSREAVPALLQLIGIETGWKNRILGRLTRRKEEIEPAEERFREAMTLPVVRALERIGDPKAAELIAGCLEHADPLVRCHTIRAFINAGWTAGLERLKPLAQSDPNEMVKELAQIAVAKLSPLPNNLNN